MYSPAGSRHADRAPSSRGVADLYILDTNVYIDAQRSREQNALLRRFVMRVGGRIRLAGVVVMELRAGASSAEQIAAWQALVAPYRERGWVVGASFEGSAEAGRVLAELTTKGGARRGGVAPSLVADALLATGCREAGATLVTRNARDFAAIQRHLRGFRFVEPWSA